jgi:hypothetical protein
MPREKAVNLIEQDVGEAVGGTEGDFVDHADGVGQGDAAEIACGV